VFYYMFYFTCDRSLTHVKSLQPASVDDTGSRGEVRSGSYFQAFLPFIFADTGTVRGNVCVNGTHSIPLHSSFANKPITTVLRFKDANPQAFLQECTADARVTSDSSACLKAPRELV